MLRIDEIWLSTQPMDMRASMDTAMVQVLIAFGYIKPHYAYLFCNNVVIIWTCGAWWARYLVVWLAIGTREVPLSEDLSILRGIVAQNYL